MLGSQRLGLRATRSTCPSRPRRWTWRCGISRCAGARRLRPWRMLRQRSISRSCGPPYASSPAWLTWGERVSGASRIASLCLACHAPSGGADVRGDALSPGLRARSGRMPRAQLSRVELGKAASIGRVGTDFAAIRLYVFGCGKPWRGRLLDVVWACESRRLGWSVLRTMTSRVQVLVRLEPLACADSISPVPRSNRPQRPCYAWGPSGELGSSPRWVSLRGRAVFRHRSCTRMSRRACGDPRVCAPRSAHHAAPWMLSFGRCAGSPHCGRAGPPAD